MVRVCHCPSHCLSETDNWSTGILEVAQIKIPFISGWQRDLRQVEKLSVTGEYNSRCLALYI